MLALLMIALPVAAPSIRKEIQRDREVETMHRGKQYIRAIKLYYKKFGSYPPNVDALVKTNNIRFLRKRYIDPITGKDDWKPIQFGQNKAPHGDGILRPAAAWARRMAGIGPGGGNGLNGPRLQQRQLAFGSSGSTFGRPGGFLRLPNRHAPTPPAATDTTGGSTDTSGEHESSSESGASGIRDGNRADRADLRRRGHHRLLARQPQAVDPDLQEEEPLQPVGVRLRPHCRPDDDAGRERGRHRPACGQHHHPGWRQLGGSAAAQGAGGSSGGINSGGSSPTPPSSPPQSDPSEWTLLRQFALKRQRARLSRRRALCAKRTGDQKAN